MDIDSTSINELPIVKTAPENHAETMNNQELSSQNVMIDRATIIEKGGKKTVSFADESNTVSVEPSFRNEQSNNYDLTMNLKIIILATLFFFVFMDNKVKKYFLNILVQIFGGFLKNENGMMSQSGTLFYALLFFLFLYTTTKVIDLGALKFSLD